MIIDSHVHMGKKFDKRLVDYIMDGNYRELADQLIIDMDKAGVDVAITLGSLDTDNTKIQAEIQKRYPNRIVACAWINPRSDNALDEFKRGVEELGIRGLKLHGWWNQFALSDHELLDPLMEYCSEKKLPVVAHCGGDNTYTTPLQLEEMAKNYPDISFVMAHAGNIWLCDEGIMVTKRNKNIFIDTAYVEGYWLADAVKRLGADRVCMGSDWPWNYIESNIFGVEMGVPDTADREWVLGKTAASIFSIPWQ